MTVERITQERIAYEGEDAPMHTITLYDDDVLKVGCKERPVEDWVELDDDGELTLTEYALEQANEAGYSFRDKLWYHVKLREWHDEGFLKLEPNYEEGTVHDGPDWTTDPEAVTRPGDMLIIFKNVNLRDGAAERLKASPAQFDVAGVSRIGAIYKPGNTLKSTTTYHKRMILLRTGQEPEDAVPEEGVKEMDTSLPEWVDEDKEYELSNGKWGIPIAYRAPEDEEWFVANSSPDTKSQSHVTKEGVPTAEFTYNGVGPRIILEERNVPPSYWRDFGLDPDETWEYKGKKYRLKDEEPQVPERHQLPERHRDVALHWQGGSWYKAGIFSSAPYQTHPVLGTKRSILEEVKDE